MACDMIFTTTVQNLSILQCADYVNHAVIQEYLLPNPNISGLVYHVLNSNDIFSSGDLVSAEDISTTEFDYDDDHDDWNYKTSIIKNSIHSVPIFKRYLGFQ